MDKANIVAENYAKTDINWDVVNQLMSEIYKAGFKRGIEKQQNVVNWTRTISQTPPYGETIQMLICDDSGDNPYYYVDAGTCYGDICIVDNDLLFGKMIAWKRLDPVPSIEICNKLR